MVQQMQPGATFPCGWRYPAHNQPRKASFAMNSIVYIVGAVVIVIAVLSFFGLR